MYYHLNSIFSRPNLFIQQAAKAPDIVKEYIFECNENLFN